MTARRFANPVFVALDTPDLSKARGIARAVQGAAGGLKIGLEFITAQGPAGIREMASLGLPLFVDVKFHDIPNTVAGASRELVKLGAKFFNVPASGGQAMMRASVDATRAVDPDVKVIAVTVLTSLDDRDIETVGQRPPASDQVVRLATLAQASGLDGVVCSPQEIALVPK